MQTSGGVHGHNENEVNFTDDGTHGIDYAEENKLEGHAREQSQNTATPSPSNEAVVRRMRAAGFHPYAQPPRNTNNSQWTSPPPPPQPTPAPRMEGSSEIMAMLKTMQESTNNKDAMITQLQETIKGLNSQLASMASAMAAIQAAAGQGAGPSATNPTEHQGDNAKQAW